MTAGRSAGTEQGQGREVHGVLSESMAEVNARIAADDAWSEQLRQAEAIMADQYDPRPSVSPARDSGQFTSDAADVNSGPESSRGRDEAREAVALPQFSELLVPVEGHVLACQGCGSLVLDNPNALAMHARFHVAALLRDGTTT